MTIYVPGKGPFRYAITGENAERAAQEFEPRLQKIFSSGTGSEEMFDDIYDLRKEITKKYGITISVCGPANEKENILEEIMAKNIDPWIENLNEKVCRIRNGEDVDLDYEEREYLAWKNENLNGKRADMGKMQKWNRLKELAQSLCALNSKYDLTVVDPARNTKHAGLGINLNTTAFMPNRKEMPLINEIIALADDWNISCLSGTITLGFSVMDIWSE